MKVNKNEKNYIKLITEEGDWIYIHKAEGFYWVDIFADKGQNNR